MYFNEIFAVWTLPFFKHIPATKTLQMDSVEVKHLYYDTCWWKKKYFNEFFAVWILPFFQHIPGKSFRLKLLMYVWNTFRGHIKLQKHFRWTVCRSNIDIMIDADGKKKHLLHFLLFGLFAWKSFQLKFLMYVWNTFRGHGPIYAPVLYCSIVYMWSL